MKVHFLRMEFSHLKSLEKSVAKARSRSPLANYFSAGVHDRHPSYSIARDRTTRKMAGIAVGLSKGHQVAKRTLAPRPAQRKGVRPRPFPSAPSSAVFGVSREHR